MQSGCLPKRSARTLRRDVLHGPVGIDFRHQMLLAEMVENEVEIAAIGLEDHVEDVAEKRHGADGDIDADILF